MGNILSPKSYGERFNDALHEADLRRERWKNTLASDWSNVAISYVEGKRIVIDFRRAASGPESVGESENFSFLVSKHVLELWV